MSNANEPLTTDPQCTCVTDPETQISYGECFVHKPVHRKRPVLVRGDLMIPTPYDGQWCFHNYSEAADLINSLHRQRDEAKAGWDETSERCKVLLAALERIYGDVHANIGLLRSYAREALEWTP